MQAGAVQALCCQGAVRVIHLRYGYAGMLMSTMGMYVDEHHVGLLDQHLRKNFICAVPYGRLFSPSILSSASSFPPMSSATREVQPVW